MALPTPALPFARVGSRWDLHRTFLIVSYGLVLAAFLPIAISGEVGWVAPLGFVGAMAWSTRRDPRTDPPGMRAVHLWTGSLGVSLVGLLAWSLQDGNWLLHTMQFALLLTVSRFYLRRFAKDHLQLYALSFLLLMVGAILEPGPVFALCFFVYTIGIMWALALLHLVRELEVQTLTGPEHLLPVPPPKRRWLGLLPPKPVPPVVQWTELAVPLQSLDWRTRRLVGPQWFAATSGLALLVLSGSALFFFLFPRLGVGFFSAQTRGSKSVIGFSMDSELGNFGALKTNPEVVMRVEFPDQPELAQQAVRLRGVTFDTFGGKSWSRRKERQWPLIWDGERMRVPAIGKPREDKDKTWRAEIYLEPLSMDDRDRVLFTPPRALSVQILDADYDYLRMRRRSVQGSSSGDLTFRAPRDAALHYQVEVVEPINRAEEDATLRDLVSDYPDPIKERYLQLPDTLDKRIAPLAAKLVGTAPTPYRKATALAEALQAGWTYSLAGDQDDAAPLEDFLFGKKSGHCEYFATAMAVMLRTQGVPARTVHGFVGGEYNEYGEYRMIRQGDAHSWVEVWFADYGWRTFDPTPPSGQVPPESVGLATKLRQMVDSAELLWYQWIVEYDLERQVELLRSIAEAMRGLAGGSGLSLGPSTETVDDGPAEVATKPGMPLWQRLGIGLAVVVVGAGAWWVWRRQRSQADAGFDARLDAACAELQRKLAKRQWERQGTETWAAHAQRMAGTEPALAQRLAAFARVFDAARYDPAAPDVAIATAAAAARELARWVADQPVPKGPRRPSGEPATA